jgi:hypothetical protein
MALVVCSMFVFSIMGGCQPGEADSVSIWIDVPLDGISLPLGPVNIEGHTAGQGIQQVEIWVDDARLDTVKVRPGEGSLAYYSYVWQPAAAGKYSLSVIPINGSSKAGGPDTAVVIIGATPVPPILTPATNTPTLTPTITATQKITFTPTFTPTNTLTLTPETVVQFWADPAELQAGDCTTIHWHAENVAGVIFGGINQPLDGSYEDCLCSTQNFSLTVNYLDGSVDKKRISIPVEGTCATDTPEDDGPPPAPGLQVPANGSNLACRAKQTLAWLPVQDMNGITGYRVDVQKRGEGGSWGTAPGSPITVANKSTSISVECGFYYRWRVRATDGAGNTGDYSDWSEFSVTLE